MINLSQVLEQNIKNYHDFLLAVDQQLITSNVSMTIGYKGQLVQKIQDDMAEILLLVASADGYPENYKIAMIKKILGYGYKLSDFKINSIDRQCECEDTFFSTELPKSLSGLAQLGIQSRYNFDESYFCSTLFSFMDVFGKLVVLSDNDVTNNEIIMFYNRTDVVYDWIERTFPNAQTQDFLPVELVETNNVQSLF